MFINDYNFSIKAHFYAISSMIFRVRFDCLGCILYMDL